MSFFEEIKKEQEDIANTNTHAVQVEDGLCLINFNLQSYFIITLKSSFPLSLKITHPSSFHLPRRH